MLLKIEAFTSRIRTFHIPSKVLFWRSKNKLKPFFIDLINHIYIDLIHMWPLYNRKRLTCFKSARTLKLRQGKYSKCWNKVGKCASLNDWKSKKIIQVSWKYHANRCIVAGCWRRKILLCFYNATECRCQHENGINNKI